VVAEARRHGIYVHDSPELVGLLMGLDLDQRVPDKLYSVVAELLAWVAEMDQR
jgi:flagellar biosynthesis protein